MQYFEFYTEEEGKILLEKCNATQAGVYIQYATLIFKGESPKIKLGGLTPDGALLSAIFGIDKDQLSGCLQHLADVGLLTGSGQLVNYRKRTKKYQSRKEYLRDYHALQKKIREFEDENRKRSVREQLTNSKRKSRENTNMYMNTNTNIKGFEYDEKYYEKCDFGTKFVAWYMHCWQGRRPKAMELPAGSEMEKQFGWAKLKDAMKMAAYDGQGWWAVRKILNGEWRGGIRKGRCGICGGDHQTRNHIDK